MEAITFRELKHIAANFSIRKKVSGYRIDKPSSITNALRDLIKMKLIEPVDIKGWYVFLRPVKDLITKLSPEEKDMLGIE